MAVTNIVTRLIKDLAVTTAKINDLAVTLGKLGALASKGQLITHDGSDHVALSPGTNGYILAANSGVANGLEWIVAPVAGDVALADLVFGEIPTGTVDGSNANFVIADAPVAASERVYVNGVRMHAGAGNDYTISSDTITFLTGAIPQTGDVILVDYIIA